MTVVSSTTKGRTCSRWAKVVSTLSPEGIADPERRKRLDSAIEFWDITNREDWKVCEQMQQGTRSRRFDRGLYSAQEDVLAALDKEFLKALGR